MDQEILDHNGWRWTLQRDGLKSVTLERPLTKSFDERYADLGHLEVIYVLGLGRMNFMLVSIQQEFGGAYEHLESHGPPLDDL